MWRFASGMRTNPPDDPTEAAKALFSASAVARTSLTVVGGMAVVAHGVNRLTNDVDVVASASDLHDLLAAMQDAGFDRPSGGDSLWPLPWTPFLMTSATWPHAKFDPFDPNDAGVSADVIAGGHPFLDSLAARAVEHDTVAGRVKIATVEDVVVMKLMPYRDKDRLDILSLLTKHPELDRKYVARWAKRLDVLQKWKDVLEERNFGAVGWEGPTHAP